MSLIVNIAATFSGKKALKDAQKQINVLESSAKKLGATLGLSLSTAAVVAFGKASVKAFAEDEKAASRLAGVLDNLGLAFANPQIATYIEDLSRATGVVDDQLRPAMQALITTTGSLTNSQKLLAQAIDISAGSGVDLATVSNDLAQAYVGNTRGLRKYNLGLTQAELKAASFATIQARLTELFSGANAKYLETYAGKMQMLSTAAGEAQETIGQGLVDALITLSGDTTVADLATDMQNFATYTANTVRGLGLMISELKKIPGAGVLGDFLKSSLKVNAIAQLIGAAQKKGATKQSTGFSFFGSPMETTQKKRDAAAAAAAEKKARDNAKRIADSLKKNTAELKKQALTKKQSSLFDMEQIQIIAALKGKISEEDRLRLTLQLALITGNIDQAKKLSDQLADSIDSTGKLKQYINTLPEAPNPFKAWDEWLKTFKANLSSVVTSTPTITTPATNVPVSAFPDPSASVPEINRERGNLYGSGNVGAQTVVVQIDGKAIASALQDQSMSAGQIAYLNRRTGGFD